MSYTARLRSRVSIEDLEQPVGDEDAVGITLHDALADQHAEDPAQVAARELD